MPQLTVLQRDAILLALIDTGAPFDPAALYVSIASAVDDHGASTVFGDVTEATLADYARKHVTTFSSPFNLPDGRRAVDGPLMHYVGAGAGKEIAIAAWTLMDAATAGNLLEFGYVVPPKNIELAGDAWDFVLRVAVDPNGNWDASVILGT